MSSAVSVSQSASVRCRVVLNRAIRSVVGQQALGAIIGLPSAWEFSLTRIRAFRLVANRLRFTELIGRSKVQQCSNNFV